MSGIELHKREITIRLKKADAKLIEQLAREQASTPQIIVTEVVEVWLSERRT